MLEPNWRNKLADIPTLDLRAFVLSYELQSFWEASVILNIHRKRVMFRIRHLESYFGAQLIMGQKKRGHYLLILTPLGKMVYVIARHMVVVHDNLVQVMKYHNSSMINTLPYVTTHGQEVFGLNQLDPKDSPAFVKEQLQSMFEGLDIFYERKDTIPPATGKLAVGRYDKNRKLPNARRSRRQLPIQWD